MSIAGLILASVASFPPQMQAIIGSVAGPGKPGCIMYQADGSSGPCMPIIAISRDTAINASSQGALLTFTQGAVTRLNPNEFALLAGHEIAHYYLGHTGQSLANELAADRLGAELACRAGFSPAAGASVFRMLRAGATHPSPAQRRAVILAMDCAST